MVRLACAVDKPEFVKMVTKILVNVQPEKRRKEEIESIFDELDADGTGLVPLALVRRVLLEGKDASTMSDTSAKAGGKSRVGKAPANRQKQARVAPMPPSEAEREESTLELQKGLSKTATAHIDRMYKTHDKKKTGSLSIGELKAALERLGWQPEEITEAFITYGENEKQELKKAEFVALMVATGAFDDVTDDD